MAISSPIDRTVSDRLEMIQLLLSIGVNPHQINDAKEYPVEVAMSKFPKIAEFLLVNVQYDQHQRRHFWTSAINQNNPQWLRFMVQNNIAEIDDGSLLYAMDKKKYLVVRYLLDNHADKMGSIKNNV